MADDNVVYGFRKWPGWVFAVITVVKKGQEREEPLQGIPEWSQLN